jgi:hypothetical protein
MVVSGGWSARASVDWWDSHQVERVEGKCRPDPSPRTDNPLRCRLRRHLRALLNVLASDLPPHVE